MTITTTFEVEGVTGLVSGTFGYDDVAWTTTFTPSAVLADGIYTVTVVGQPAADGEAQQLPSIWHFQVGALPTVQLAGASYSVNEAAGVAVITVTLNGPSVAPITLTFATADGTALAGEDYVALSGTLSFAPGETEQVIVISLLDDLVYETDETFTLTLSDPVGATLGSPFQTTFTILNDELLKMIYLPIINRQP